MKALVYTGAKKSIFQECADPDIVDGETIINVACCGICGSDMHAWHGKDERRIAPLILGHEVVGKLDNGQRSAINPLMVCGMCQYCKTGQSHLCLKRDILGMRRQGGFAEKVRIKNENIYPISDQLSFEDAALAEPLACSLHAKNLLTYNDQIDKDCRIVILGGGAIGLLAAMLASHSGYKDVWIGEMNPYRRAILQKCLEVNIYDPASTTPQANTAHMVLDSVGSGKTRKASTELVAAGGRIVHIGLQDNNEGLDTRRLTLQEISFQGSYCYHTKDFKDALTLLEKGHISAKGWVEVRPLKDGLQAFNDIDQGVATPKIILQAV
ncbi:MAG: alcohol dehydrogenase catalytic domain-containing protein [Pseudomonadota bacterium]